MNRAQKIKLFPFFMIIFETAIYLSNDMYLPSMPAIAKELSLSQMSTQNTLTFWFLGASSLQFILGPLSDSYGRKIVVVLGGVLFILSSAVCAIATTLHVLLIARFVQGATICSLVASYAAIHELYSTKEAIKILALMNAITILAPAFGPLVGALIVQFATWRDIFWFLCGLGIIGTLLIVFFMPESNDNWHDLNLKRITRDYLEIFTNMEFMIPSIGYCLLFAIFFGWMFAAPFLMIEKYATTNLYYGLSQAFIFGCFLIGAKLTDHMLLHHNLKKLIWFALLVSILGVILFLLNALLVDKILYSIIAMMVISTGTSMLFGPVNRIAIEASAHPMGRRTAVFSVLISLSGALTGWSLSVLNINSLISLSVLFIICISGASLSILFIKINDA
jgi:DHA1 family multidrug/chloramphenicol efflux transport protein-like MFS transporter